MSALHKIDFSKSTVPLHIKFALVCLNKITIPKWLGMFFFIISHIQVIAIIVKSAYIALPDDTPSVSPVIKALLKYFIVGDWINYGNSTPLLIRTSIITIFILQMLAFLIYIHLSLALKWRIPGLIQYYWSTLHTLHPLLIFFWIHTFCVNIINYPTHYEVVHGIKVSLQAMAYFNTIVNCILAVFLSMISATYKTKDVMASKTNIMETKSIVFKMIIPLLWRTAENNQGVQILILVLILVNAIVHDLIFVKYLPYYRINMLVLSSILQSIETSLALVGFIVKLIETGESNIGIFTFQIAWLWLVPFAIKGYYSETWKILLYIFGCEIKNEKNIYYLVHKRIILLYFLKSRTSINPGVNKISYVDIFYQAKLVDIVLGSDFSFAELDRNKALLTRNLKVICLEILSRYPKTLLVQINLAYSHSKFEDLYIVANNMLEDVISKGPGFHTQISLNMIRLELQKKLMVQASQKAEDEQASDGLNVSNYIVNQELHEEMKNSIKEQTKLQINFWNEFLSSRSDMLKLLNLALKVDDQKRAVKKLWNNLLKIRSKSFLPPLIVYGMYSSLINNNPMEGEKYLERSREDLKKLKKTFKMNELSNQTIFSEKTVQIIMSGLRSKLGRIVGCSSNISNFYGWQASEMKDKPVAFLMPPFYRQRHDSYLLEHFNTGKTKTLNTTEIVPVKRSNGYIHPTWLHTKVSPVMKNGIFYVGLLRPCKSRQRMVLVRKDGKIDDMSLGFARDMNLSGKESQIECDIFTLCPEFRQINEAFNVIAERQRTEKTMSYSKDEPNDQQTSATNLLYKKCSLKLLMTTQPDVLKTNQETEGNFGTLTDRFPTENTDRPLISTRRRKFTIEQSNSRPITFEGTGIDIIKETNSYIQMELNSAQQIYATFLEGSRLAFYPRTDHAQQRSPRGFSRFHTPTYITYNVKVMNSIHGNEVIKYVLLEKVSEEGGESADGKTMAESSADEARFPSLKIWNKKESKNKTMKKNTTQGQGKEKEIISPVKIISPTSLSSRDTEEAELMCFSLSPRVKTETKFPEPTVNDDDDGANLSILNEVQSEDSRDRKAVLRCVLGENENDAERKGVGAPMTKLDIEAHNKKIGSQVLQTQEEDFVQQGRMKFHRIKPRFNSTLHGTIEESDNSSYINQGKKTEQLMIQALKANPIKRSTFIFKALYILFLIAGFILLAFQSKNLTSGINEVQAQVPVISAAFYRQYNMISSATQVLSWKGTLDGFFTLVDWPSDNYKWKFNLEYYVGYMQEQNTLFYNLLANLPAEIQSQFHEKNVGIYEYDENRNRTLVSMGSTFESLQMMMEREISCIHTDVPSQFEPGIDTSTFKFIFDNILNDLLIEIENQVDHLIDYMDDSANNTTLKTAAIMIGVFFVCLVFVVISIRYLFLIASEARVFMTMIFRMNPKDCEAIQLTLQGFEFWLNTDVNDQDVSLTEKLKRRSGGHQDNYHSARFRKAKMGSLYNTQRIAFLKLLPILCLFIFWSIAYFFLTSNFVGDIQDSEKRMEAALRALNNQTLFVTELESVPLGNFSAVIKNRPLMANLQESLDYLKQVDVFVDNFRDRHGQLTELQQKVLFGFPCQDLLPYVKKDYNVYVYPYYSCFVNGKGKDKIGLVDINSELYSGGNYIIDLYNNSSKTEEELANILVLGLVMLYNLCVSAEGFFKLLVEATEESFEQEVDSVKTTTTYLVVWIVLVTLLGAILTWHFVLKRIFRIQKVDWFILQLIPLKLIKNNKHLQQYLLKHSNGILTRTKTFL